MTEKGIKNAKTKTNIFERFDRIHRKDHEKMMSIEEAYKLLEKKKVLCTPIPLNTKLSLSSSKRIRPETPMPLVSILDDYPIENLPPPLPTSNHLPSTLNNQAQKNTTSDHQRKYVKIKKLQPDAKSFASNSKQVPKVENIRATKKEEPKQIAEVKLKRKATEVNSNKTKKTGQHTTNITKKEKEKKKISIQIKE